MQFTNTLQRLPLLAAALCLFASVEANASAINYSVDLTSLDGATFKGTITTDGTIGALAAANFTDWALTYTYGSLTAVLNQGNASVRVINFGADRELQATASSLFMINNASLRTTLFDIKQNNTPLIYFRVNGEGSISSPFGAIQQSADARIAGNGILSGISNEQVTNFANSGAQFTIGTVSSGSTSSVPEPATLSLLAFGLAGLTARRRLAA